MSFDTVSNLKFEIGHVLFIDIIGYSKLLITEQSELLRKLTEIVRETEQFRRAKAEDNLIHLPTGDGMALVFRNSPETPVQCALELTKRLKAYPDLLVRMGIHSGPVNEVSDVGERANVTGAGINMAQRVMDCGDSGHILLSKHVADDLEQYPQWRSHLHDVGECEVKHGVRLHLFNFYGDGFGNAQMPARLRFNKTERLLKKGKMSGLFVAIAMLLLAVSALFLWRSRTTGLQPAQSTAVAPEKSIAVLPFENLSDDKGNAYFVEGIQDEILTRLAKVADLKVLSRTSTQRFTSKPENLPEIARQLGVAHILEGSTQRSTGQVRVNVQLIKAATDANLWAETYDRKMTGVFGVETEIATKIADVLRAKLSGAEHRAMASRPTENMEAHDLYLRGRFFAGKRIGPDLKHAINYYSQAIEKDPKYALAYAGIANSYALLPQYSNKPEADAFAKARSAADKALAIDPNLAEAHAALALVRVLADLNFKEAKSEFERSIELNPNSADAHYFFGITVLAPLGQFDQAVAEIKHAIALDPFSAIMNANLGYTYILARRYSEAIAQLRKTEELDPNFPYTQACLGQALWLSGDTSGAIAHYEKAERLAHARGSTVEYDAIAFLAQLYGLHGQRPKALQLLTKVTQIEARSGTVWRYNHAVIQIGLGGKEQAIDWLERSYQAKETGVIIYFKVDPILDRLRGEPRFEKLANKVVPPDTK